ncbi:PI31 proteasome regulator N-terminal-domain-containing protein [Parasitella parasitica]|nr:PI31 proteasome regulator N-terminal-domain-containing protein [Parasitella parasitica]
MSEQEKNVLDPASIIHSTSQNTPTLSTPYDAIAAACHSIMINVGFRFAGLGDDACQEGDGSLKRLPDGWNQQGPHCYNFRYSHPQSSLTFVIKVVRLADKCIILGLGIGDNKTATFEITIEDYTSNSFFPYNASTSDQPLIHGFISSTRFNDFIMAYKLNILQRLIPGLNKPGYEDESNSGSSTTATTTTTNTSAVPPVREPLIPNTNIATQPPIFGSTDDPAFPDVGRSDWNPLSGLGGGGGMRVGPGHPIFGNRGGDNLHDPSGLFGGPEPLPRGSVPPGARFDPIGPFGSLPVRPPSGNRLGRRDPRGFHSGEPDNDELQPPGYNDMFG